MAVKVLLVDMPLRALLRLNAEDAASDAVCDDLLLESRLALDKRAEGNWFGVGEDAINNAKGSSSR